MPHHSRHETTIAARMPFGARLRLLAMRLGPCLAGQAVAVLIVAVIPWGPVRMVSHGLVAAMAWQLLAGIADLQRVVVEFSVVDGRVELRAFGWSLFFNGPRRDLDPAQIVQIMAHPRPASMHVVYTDDGATWEFIDPPLRGAANLFAWLKFQPVAQAETVSARARIAGDAESRAQRSARHALAAILILVGSAFLGELVRALRVVPWELIVFLGGGSSLFLVAGVLLLVQRRRPPQATSLEFDGRELQICVGKGAAPWSLSPAEIAGISRLPRRKRRLSDSWDYRLRLPNGDAVDVDGELLPNAGSVVRRLWPMIQRSAVRY